MRFAFVIAAFSLAVSVLGFVSAVNFVAGQIEAGVLLAVVAAMYLILALLWARDKVR